MRRGTALLIEDIAVLLEQRRFCLIERGFLSLYTILIVIQELVFVKRQCICSFTFAELSAITTHAKNFEAAM